MFTLEKSILNFLKLPCLVYNNNTLLPDLQSAQMILVIAIWANAHIRGRKTMSHGGIAIWKVLRVQKVFLRYLNMRH